MSTPKGATWERTAAQLVAATSLTTLSLNHVPVSESTVVQLTNLKRLTHLRLAGSSVSPAMTKRLLDTLYLTELDLSGQAFSVEHAQAIIDGIARVQVLVLRESKLDPQAIERLAIQLLELKFDLGGAILPVELEARLLASERLVLEEDASRAWAVLASFNEQSASADPQARPRAAIIDPRVFAPSSATPGGRLQTSLWPPGEHFYVADAQNIYQGDANTGMILQAVAQLAHPIATWQHGALSHVIFGCYENGNVFRFDGQTGQLRDVGVRVSGETGPRKWHCRHRHPSRLGDVPEAARFSSQGTGRRDCRKCRATPGGLCQPYYLRHGTGRNAR